MDGTGIKYGKRFNLSFALISAAASLLVHIPEFIGLLSISERYNLFPYIRPIEVFNEVIFTFLSLLILFCVNTVVFRFYKTSVKSDAIKTQNLVFLLFSFMLCWITSALLSHAFYHLHLILKLPVVQATVHHYLHPVRDFIISCTVTVSCYIISIIHEQQRIVLENQQLKLENILSRYQTLKTQLNPHILFNSLNTLCLLIHEDPVKAQNFTQKLSDVLRYMLQDNVSQKISLAEELAFIEGFIFLLTMRYEDNLSFEMKTDKKWNSYLLPPMSLQILIENAVKHNEISNRHPLAVTVETTENGTLCVSNSIQPKLTATVGTGIGLDNLVKRYHLLFNKEIIIDNTNNMFRVVIPLINPIDHEDAHY